MNKKLFFRFFLSCLLWVNFCTFLFALAPENSPLYWGNPSEAISSLEEEGAAENFLMEKPQFTLSYNNKTHNPNWVAWHLCAEDLGDADRVNNFRPDLTLPKDWYAVRKADYKFTAYGFDRGHLCPSADRTASEEDNSETFLMTNMVPQSPDNNRIVWVALEKYEREQVLAGREAYIFAGPVGRGGSGDRGYFEAIPLAGGPEQQGAPVEQGAPVQQENMEIQVPSHTWKIILFLPQGENDFERAAKENQAQVLAVNVPNIKGCSQNGSWQQYICTVNYIEEITGYDFFNLLPDELEEQIESSLFSW